MTPAEWEDWQEALKGLSTWWVAVRCDVDVASARERPRPDRYRGLARGTSLAVHRYARYDAEVEVEVETSSLGVEEAAAVVDAQLRLRP